MEALDHLMAGRFIDAISAYRRELKASPGDISLIAGLANAYMGAAQYSNAIPLKWQIHEADKAEVPDHPGQHLYLAVAYWCLGNQIRAIELAKGLCAAILDRSVNMAPDLAGGATFGLVLYYMALTAGDDANREYALRFLKTLNDKYDKQPALFRYPVGTVKQLLGEASFEDALSEATIDVLASKPGTRDLGAAYLAAEQNRSIKLRLGQVLFYDGAICRANGKELACNARMKEVFALGYQTDPLCWYLARHEVKG